MRQTTRRTGSHNKYSIILNTSDDVSAIDSPAPAGPGHPHRSGAQSLSGNSVLLASLRPLDTHTPHFPPASSSSDRWSYQTTVSLAGYDIEKNKNNKTGLHIKNILENVKVFVLSTQIANLLFFFLYTVQLHIHILYLTPLKNKNSCLMSTWGV